MRFQSAITSLCGLLYVLLRAVGHHSGGTKRLVSVNICLVEGNSAGISVSNVSAGIFVIKEK